MKDEYRDYRVTFSEGHDKNVLVSYKVRAKDTTEAYEKARRMLEREHRVSGSLYFFIEFA